MAELKTKQTDASVEKYLDKAAPTSELRADCDKLVAMMSKATKAPPKMWGTAIIGFGTFCYQYHNGKEMNWMLCGFSPRKANISLYLFGRFPGYSDLLEKMGKHACGAACVYVKRLSDVHLPTLQKLINGSVKHVKQRGSADREQAKAQGRKKRAATKKTTTKKNSTKG
jgi:hypothetical protein